MSAAGNAAIRGATSSPKPTSPTATRVAAMSPRRLVFSMFSPAKPRKAGSSVSDAKTVSATVTDAVTARPCTKPMPMRSMPSTETTTVAPANSTARPAVSMAMATDSRTVWPAWSCSRWRVMISSA